MNTDILKKMFASRKFWYTIVAILVPLMSDWLGLTAEEVEKFLYAVVALIVGQGLADSGKK